MPVLVRGLESETKELSVHVRRCCPLDEPPVLEQAKHKHGGDGAEHDQGDFEAGGVIWQIRQVAQPIQLRQRPQESTEICSSHRPE